eukprot:1143942-Pelagomonas_calceolata.AAC.5
MAAGTPWMLHWCASWSGCMGGWKRCNREMQTPGEGKDRKGLKPVPVYKGSFLETKEAGEGEKSVAGGLELGKGRVHRQQDTPCIDWAREGV